MANTRITQGVIKPNENYLAGIITAQNINVTGVLTYEDVTNVDSIGVITARKGIVSSGVVTATAFHGDGSQLTGIDATALKDSGGNVKIQAQASGAVHTGFSTMQNLRVTGIATFGSGSTTIDNNVINVGTALTLGHTQGLQFHTQNLHSQGFEINNINASGIITAAQFSGDGSNLENLPAGLGTALSSTQSSPLNKIYYTNTVLPVESTVTVDTPASASAAYTQYADISLADGADLIISDGDDLIPDVLGLRPDGTFGGGSLSRMRVDKLVGKNGNSAVNVEKGLVITGVTTSTNVSVASSVTATTYYGSGANLTGIVADKIFEGNTEVETVDTGTDGHVKFTLEGDEKARIAGVGSFGLGETAPVCSFDASSKSDAIQVPNGTTGERPSGISTAHSYGMIRYNETIGVLEKYDANGWSPIDNPPIVSSFSGVLNQNTNTTITITGSGFKTGAVVSIEGAAVGNNSRALTTTFVNGNTLTAATNAASVNYVDNAAFDIKVTNQGGLNAILAGAGTVDSTLTWTTSAGSLGTWNDGSQSYSVTVAATDPDSTAVTYAVTSGSLPPNTTLNASSGVISTNGIGSIGGSSVTYSFTITATSNTIGVARAFTITGNPAPDGSSASRATTPDYLRNTLSITTDGNYWIKTTGMSSAVQCYINFGMLDSKDWLLMARWSGVSGGNSPWGTAINDQNENDHVGKDIPFKGFSFDNNGSHTYSYFSSYSPYNKRRPGTNNGSTTSSGGNKGGYRLYIGLSGGMGWYGTQTHNACNWQSSAGMVGAGYNHTCGSYPGSLQFGTGQGGPFMGSFFSGTLRMWIWMDNKQPIA